MSERLTRDEMLKPFACEETGAHFYMRSLDEAGYYECRDCLAIYKPGMSFAPQTKPDRKEQP